MSIQNVTSTKNDLYKNTKLNDQQYCLEDIKLFQSVCLSQRDNNRHCNLVEMIVQYNTFATVSCSVEKQNSYASHETFLNTSGNIQFNTVSFDK